MRRRDFLGILGGAATAWPLASRAQQTERMRRVGVLMALPDGDSDGLTRVQALRQGLQELGWIDGQNIQIIVRWAGGHVDQLRSHAAELTRLSPDVLVPNGSAALAALRQINATIPTVFVGVVDPVASGFVASLARPGGKITGFTTFEHGLTGKWVELLKEAAPQIVRFGFVYSPDSQIANAQLQSLRAASSKLEPISVGNRNPTLITKNIEAFAAVPNGGLIILADAVMTAHSKLIVGLAARLRLPAIYPLRTYVIHGGLMSYGDDPTNRFRRASAYIDRILKGADPGELPVQGPVTYELVVNLKAAKTIGLDVSPIFLARADEVIE